MSFIAFSGFKGILRWRAKPLPEPSGMIPRIISELIIDWATSFY